MVRLPTDAACCPDIIEDVVFSNVIRDILQKIEHIRRVFWFGIQSFQGLGFKVLGFQGFRFQVFGV